MNFHDLHELLRQELLRRIEDGPLTGTALARQAGYKQGHISNFLRRKRSLSLEGLDRVMAAQNLTVDQLLPLELSGAAAMPLREELADAVPVVPASVALAEPMVRPEQVVETVQVAAAHRPEQRGPVPPRRAGWQRFVAVRADEQQAAAMDPVLTPGAIAVLDRHCVSLAPHRPERRSLYAVRTGAGLALRYVDFDAGTLILRPLAAEFPVQLMPLAARESPADYIVGRVCAVYSAI
jgi:transcriptional regulator with XRE-family HTH domain